MADFRQALRELRQKAIEEDRVNLFYRELRRMLLERPPQPPLQPNLNYYPPEDFHLNSEPKDTDYFKRTIFDSL
jgi:hypothetical protein